MRPNHSSQTITGRGLFYRLLIYAGWALALFAIAGGGLAVARWLSLSTSQGNGTRPIPGHL